MCGICGALSFINKPFKVTEPYITRMRDTMIHRGPDDEGCFLGRGSALAMRRLAIIDVAGGVQPMSSEDGRVHSVVNGELYNFVELRDRLSALVSFEGLKLAAAVVLLSPFIPLLFMGEEYGETAPFPYFVSHSDPDLIEAIRRGRREEFAHLDSL